MKYLFAVLLALTCIAATPEPPDVIPGRLKVRLQADIPRHLHREILAQHGLTILYPILPYDRSVTAELERSVIPHVDPHNDPHVDPHADPHVDLHAVLRLERDLLRSYVVTYTNPAPPNKMISLLRTGCSQIEVAEPVVIEQLLGVPNDPRVNEQQMLLTIKAFDGWDIHEGSDTVLIGISDSGVMQDHEDLKDAIAVNGGEVPDNNIDDDGNGYIDDHRGYNFCTQDDGTPPGNTYNPNEGHGTAVAGITGASVNNALGIAGVANKCKIVPLKTMPDNVRGIVYGYESIMYCALNGIDVVNCSWGSQSESCINESVVAYAVARGVAVVAAAGNHGLSAPFYPGSYQGVMNAGVTDPNDNVIAMSGHGPTVDIMAPGQGTVATSNDGTYGGFCCTSGSSPIVAGLVALVRSQRPELSGLQACAVVREMVDESPWLSVPSTIDPRLLPKGRVNVVKALDTSTASRTIASFEVFPNMISTTSTDTRWAMGDTITINVPVMNVLDSAYLNTLVISDVISSSSSAIDLVNTAPITLDRPSATGDTVLIGPIAAEIMRDTDTTEFISTSMLYRRTDGLMDTVAIKIPLTPAPAYRVLQNDVMQLSVGDRARIGNTDLERSQGTGLSYRQWCGQLFEGGLMVSTGAKVVDAVRAGRRINDHFRPSKRFTRPDALHSIVTDADAPDSMRIGVEIEQVVYLGEDSSSVFYTDVTVKNISDSTLPEIALGWFCDWDLGDQPLHNVTDLEWWSIATAVQFVASTDSAQPVLYMQTSSQYADALPIAAGLDNTTTYSGFPASRKSAILHSGTSTQYGEQNDVATVVGMQFTSPLPPNHERSFRFAFAIDTSHVGAQNLLNSLPRGPESTDSLFTTLNGVLYPNPASSIVYLPLRSQVAQIGMYLPAEVTMYDVQGRQVFSQEYPELSLMTSNTVLPIDVSGLPNGTYQIVFTDPSAAFGSTPSTFSLVIVR